MKLINSATVGARRHAAELFLHRNDAAFDVHCGVEGWPGLGDMTVHEATSGLRLAIEQVEAGGSATVAGRVVNPEFNDERWEWVCGMRDVRKDIIRCADILGAGAGDLVRDLCVSNWGGVA